MTKRLILTILLFGSPLWATTYYVDNCVTVGNDLNKAASPSAPWRTINKVNASKFNPGDSILFQSTCTWREQLTVPSSGSAGNPITFGAYGTGAAPIISGADVFSSWITEGSLYYSSASVQPNQVFLDGQRLTLAASKTALATGKWWWDATNLRVYVYDNPSGNTIEASQRQYGIYGACTTPYVTVSGIEVDKANYRGVYFCGGNGVLITGVTPLRSFESGVRLDGGVGVTVTQSTAAYNGMWGFAESEVSNLQFDRLTAHDNAQLATSGWGGGIYLSGISGTGSQTVQYSQSYNNGVGSLGYLGAGIYADTVDNSFLAKYNLVYGNTYDGIAIDADNYATVMYNIVFNDGGGGILVFADANASMTGQLIYNNTVVGNGGLGITMLGPSAGSAPAGCTNNRVENNIATDTVSGPNLAAFLGCENSGINGSGNIYNNNDFGAETSNFIQWGGTFSSAVYESTYSAWETATGSCGTLGCSHSVQADPQFANATAAQFWPASGSPAIDAGTNLGSPYNIGLLPSSSWSNSVVTSDQNAYGSGWELGAFLFVPTITPPSNLQAVAH